MQHVTWRSILPLFVGGLAAPLPAQATLYEYRNAQPDGSTVVCGLGDVNGDGHADFALGKPGSGNSRGAVNVMSGADGSRLYQATVGGASIYGFGNQLRNVGDLDQDGIADFFVGSSDRNDLAPHGHILSGSDGHILLGPFDGATVVEPAGDVDGDGTLDWIESRDGGSGPTAVVEVRSGQDAAILHSIKGQGWSAPQVAGLGDLDGDGHAEFVVGDYEAANSAGNVSAGVVVVHSGFDGSELRREEGTQDWSYLGYLMNRVGDLDRDGLNDYAVLDMTDQARTGRIRLRIESAASGAVVLKLVSSDFLPFGSRVLDGGDVNGDGISDIVTGEDFWSGEPGPRIYSGRTGQLLYRHFGGGLITFNYDIDAAGDVDGDGLADLLLGGMESSGATQDEVVRVTGGNDLWLAASTAHAYPTQTLELTTREGVPGAATVTVLLEFGGVPMFKPIDGLASFDATGTHVVSHKVPSGLAGLDAKVQAFALDRSGRTQDTTIEVIHFE